MAAEVSSQDRILSGAEVDLVTRDLLGGFAVLRSAPDQLDLSLKSETTYLEKSEWDPIHRLPPPPAVLRPSLGYESVCTLEKVRSALERAERESRNKKRRRLTEKSNVSAASTCSSSSTVSSSIEMPLSSPNHGMMASGCPNCLMYVLISKGNPRCPKCDSHVPTSPLLRKNNKQRRIDLNSSQY